jgi:hypothetical protein
MGSDPASLGRMTKAAIDVAWASRLLSRISDAQGDDAFRAAGYPPDQAARCIAKIKARIAEGREADS